MKLYTKETSWPVPNTGIRFGQYWQRYFFRDLGRFVVETEDSKIMGGLRIMTRYRIKNIKKSILLQKCPFKKKHFRTRKETRFISR